MNDTTKIIAAVLLTAVICIAGSAAVFSSGANDSDNRKNLVIAGSTTVQPLMSKLQEEFEKYTGISLSIGSGGSSAGASAVIQNTADIGMMSRDPKPSELAEGLVATVIGMDAVVVIVSKDAGVTSLTMEQIALIYSGEYTNWNQVGGNNQKINPIVREEGSGTRDCIEEALLNAVENYETSEAFPAEASTGSMKTRVENTSGAIGYVSLSAASELGSDTVAVNVDGIEASVETVSENSYPIYRNLILVTKGAPTGAEQFLFNWILSEDGQAIVESMGFVKVAL